MRPTTTDEVFDLLNAHIDSAALGAAMELGLFWLLVDGPRDAAALSRELDVPPGRCRYWLQILARAGLIAEGSSGYSLTAVSLDGIVSAYSHAIWAFLAGEIRDRAPAFRNLALHIREPKSIWDTLGLTPPDYFARMVASPEEARRFTRMLYEIHLPMAEAVAAELDLAGAERLMDVGGGSGVMSLALLRKYDGLVAEVLDIPNVCAVGREIARENGMEDRISYTPIDFRQDELPTGYDAVLDCDVGVYDEPMLAKLHPALNSNGRLIIIDQFAPAPGVAPPGRLDWALQDSMHDPEFADMTAGEVKARLARVGFRGAADRPLPPAGVKRWTGDWIIIEAFK